VRVVHLTSSHPPDDVRIFLKECRSLAEAGYEVHLVAPGRGGQKRDGIEIHTFELPDGPRPVRIPRRLWRAWRSGRRLEPDICQFHEPELVPVALLLKASGARIVYDVHEDYAHLDYEPYSGGGRRLGFRLLEALARRTCDGFVAATPRISQRFPAPRTIALPNFPLLEETEALPERPPPVLGADVVYVGGISRARGVAEMLQAAGLLRTSGARLVLIGSFETREVECEARTSPGWSRVEYLGQLARAEVAPRLAAARVGLLVFRPERDHVQALPNKLFEYMAAGLPVIASDFPYWRELLEPVGCATFVDPLDPTEIAAAIDNLLGDQVGAREMGDRGAAAVRDRLNWEQEAPKLLELYERLGLPAAA
jgi:glycosyltransferase involved in cell wall biosynthesis